MSSMSMEEAIAIKTRFEGEVLRKPGVTGVDVGRRQVGGRPTQELALRVYVDRLADAPALPAQVDGLPVEVIERRFDLH